MTWGREKRWKGDTVSQMRRTASRGGGGGRRGMPGYKYMHVDIV